MFSLEIGKEIQLNEKKGIVLNVTGNDVLILKSGVKQPQWMKLDYLRIFNKGI